ncbi:MAG TPA: HupE/UreJ family protein [Pirellulales bacterium]|jgi:urease accessory protein|nr:HupE/UreJ family protein [Pirellulales bacterium]
MRSSKSVLLSLFALLAVLLCAQPAWAHPGHPGHSFTDGFTHPFSGIDHLLAMVAVGLLAVRIGGKALWILPCMFLGGMFLGGILAAMGVPLPAVEQGIQASVLILGVLIALTQIVPLSIGAGLVALFAVFHGYAHAAEMASGNSWSAYAVGFLLATAILHFSGVAGGLTLNRWLSSKTVRLTGGLISLAGIFLVCGAL